MAESRSLPALLLVLLIGGACRAEPATLLFTGSSSSYWHDMPREVARLVSGQILHLPGAEIRPEIVGRSGSDIKVYSEPGFSSYEYGVNKGQTYLEKIASERPGLVVLQAVAAFITDPANTTPDGGNAHAAALTAYIQAIRAAGGEPIVYEMGWGRDERTATGRNLIRALARAQGIRYLAPCSTAWATVYRERPEIELQHPRDSSHPGNHGLFLNLACFYAALTGKNPVGVLPRTFPVWPPAGIKPEDPAAEEAQANAYTPTDAYQAAMPKWMRRHMAKRLTYTIDDALARSLEKIAWKSHLEWTASLPHDVPGSEVPRNPPDPSDPPPKARN